MHISYKAKRILITGVSLGILIILYAFKNAAFTLRVFSTIGFLIFFYLIDHIFGIRFMLKHYIYAILIAVTGFLLSPLYFIYPNYDKILHLVMPLIYSSIIFYVISKLKLELKWKLTFTLFISLGIVGLFEIGEYLLDIFFDLKLQGVFLRNLQGIEKFDILLDRNDDTMIDMSIGTISSLIYVITTAVCLRKRN